MLGSEETASHFIPKCCLSGKPHLSSLPPLPAPPRTPDLLPLALTPLLVLTPQWRLFKLLPSPLFRRALKGAGRPRQGLRRLRCGSCPAQHGSSRVLTLNVGPENLTRLGEARPRSAGNARQRPERGGARRPRYLKGPPGGAALLRRRLRPPLPGPALCDLLF